MIQPTIILKKSVKNLVWFYYYNDYVCIEEGINENTKNLYPYGERTDIALVDEIIQEYLSKGYKIYRDSRV